MFKLFRSDIIEYGRIRTGLVPAPPIQQDVIRPIKRRRPPKFLGDPEWGDCARFRHLGAWGLQLGTETRAKDTNAHD